MLLRCSTALVARFVPLLSVAYFVGLSNLQNAPRMIAPTKTNAAQIITTFNFKAVSTRGLFDR
jgi:hypothetical protein